MEKVGSKTTASTLASIAIDKNLKIISAPCYMMEATILEVSKNIEQAISALDSL
jgi:enhancing lycopene biosynthesis protein 2